MQIRTAIALTAFAGLTAGTASATVLFTEDFSYADGSLTSNAAWDTHSGTAGQIQVSGGAITLMDTDSEDANRLTGSTLGAADSIFASLDVTVSAAAPVGGGDYEYFAHFGTGASDFTARIDVVEGNSGGDFTFGLGFTSTAETTWGTDLSFGTTYTLVLGYDRATGLATLWVDPASAASTSISTSTPDDNAVTGFYFRQSSSSANETIVVDNLVVATDVADLLVPEPGSLALLGLGGLMIARRRRG